MPDVLEALEARKRTMGGAVALRTLEVSGVSRLTWSDYREAVALAAERLREKGVGAGKRVALQLPASDRLFAQRLALLDVGATAIVLSPRLPAPRRAALLRDCGADWLITSSGIRSLSKTSKGSTVRHRAEAIVFSAGRGGRGRKQVALSSANLLFAARSLTAAYELSEKDVVLSHLPPSRLAEQLLSLHCAVLSGAQVDIVAESLSLKEKLLGARPTVLFGPPRFWGELRAVIAADLSARSSVDPGLLKRAMSVSRERLAADRAGHRVGGLSELEHRGYVHSLLRPLKAAFGLDRCRVALSSGAPLGDELRGFFDELDLPVHELYGQAEAAGLSAQNVPGESRPGSVGRPLLGVEVRIAPDGEIWLRSGGMGRGSFELRGGWLATGDLGRLDDDGFLFIEGRKR